MNFRPSRLTATFLIPVVLFILWTNWSGPVFAHTVKLSSSKLAVGGRMVEAALTLNAVDLEAALDVRLRAKAGGAVVPRLLAEAAGAIAGYVTKRAAVLTREGALCTPEAASPKSSKEKVLLDVSWRCPPVHGGLIYRVTLFQELDPTARHIVIFTDGSGRFVLLGANAREVSLAGARASLSQVVSRYLVAGIEHIAIGFDHIAFVIGIILWGRRFWPLFKVVTAFTLAHSVTLSLAVLEIVALPSQWVEALIAASIVYVAVENFFIRKIDRRWRLTFLFGLIHGFGFAGVLRQFGLPDQAIVPALASFNVGVEIGQLAIVLIVLSTLLLIDRTARRATDGHERNPKVVYACSGLIFLFGAYLLIERTILA
ncbi:MAG: HupE/UreJ family protein [Alphaproteobacteria bacterium]|nr:HupE/UreJ family protein [Alphaproteobacteria bacterium]